MIKYIDSITLLGLCLLLISTMLIDIPTYTPTKEQEIVAFSGTISKIHQSNKTSLITIQTACSLPIRIFHQKPYNFSLNETISGYGELTKEKEIIAQKLIAQIQVIR